MSDQIRVFVASTSEQIRVARRIEAELKKNKRLDVRVWNEGVFEFSATYIESLERELDRADFAVVLLTGEDTGRVRGKRVLLPRDNVIFELGLFQGRMGRDRCFFYVKANADTRIASDLSGVEPVNFYPSGHGAKPTLEQQSARVVEQMLRRGVRRKQTPEARAEQDQLWHFAAAVAGHWWERMHQGEDDKSALSYVVVSLDEKASNPLIMEGEAFDLGGDLLAHWRSVITGIVLGLRPKVFYRWEGSHDVAAGQLYGGGGEFTLDGHDFQGGRGHYYDTNFALVGPGRGRAASGARRGAATRIKRFRMYRCTTPEIEIMATPWTAQADALIRNKVRKLRGN